MIIQGQTTGPCKHHYNPVYFHHWPHLSSTQNDHYPVNTKYLYNIYTMLDQRQRRWADVVYTNVCVYWVAVTYRRRPYIKST